MHLVTDEALCQRASIAADSAGDVPPNKDKTLKIPSDVPPGSSFRLVAERSAISRPVVSQPVTATTDGLIIDWSLQTNAIWFPESGN